MTSLRRQSNKRVQASFVGSRVFVSIPFKGPLFEPRLFRTIVAFKPIEEYYRDFMAAIGIVEELNLDTRIWTKE